MQCEFSETQFMFGIMRELANKCYRSGKGWEAPFFPTQREEKVLGYDTAIHGPVKSIFFQFKVPEKKTMANSKYWHEMGGPYFEIKIWPDAVSPQHNTLRDLAGKDPRNKVFYCAPRFHKTYEYDDNFRKETIAQNSVYILCGSLKPIAGNDAHNICYTTDPHRAPVMHSEPREVKSFTLQELEWDLEKTPAYQNAMECLSAVAERFSIKVQDRENARRMYREIAEYLLINENIVFVLMEQ